MQNLSINDVKAFAAAIEELYTVFFKKYPYLKFLVIKALMHDNGCYGLVIAYSGLVLGKYSIFKTSEGLIVENGLNEHIGLKLNIDIKLMKELTENKLENLKKPVRLLGYLPGFLRNISNTSQNVYANQLRGNKVILRPADDSDMPYLIKWYNDYELNKLAGWSDGKVSSSKLKYNMMRSFGSDPLNLMIDDLNSNPIGTIQLYDFSKQDRSCKLGIRIGDKDYWNTGYGSDAVSTIVKYAFLSLNINRVALRVYEYNERAARCYEKCGFKQEGRSRKSAYIDGEYYDEILMGLLKNEYMQKNLRS